MTYAAQRTNGDGTPMMSSAADEAAEREVAALLARTWRCEIHKFGPLTPIDFYALRDGRLVAMIELRCRTTATTDFEHVPLNVRKWLSLMLAHTGLGVEALWVVRFADGVRWVHIQDVDARDVRMFRKGVQRVGSDAEPAVYVPVASMRALS